MICLIIAAGKQRRFASEIPKALSKLPDGTILAKRNFDLLSTVGDTYIVVNSLNHRYFSEVFDESDILDIGESGLGSGDAIYKAISMLDTNDEVVSICWGDVILTNDHIDFLASNRNECYGLFIPTRNEFKPYVSLDRDGAHFSKYGDDIPEYGDHDLSIFISNISALKQFCKKFIDKYFNGTDYDHVHGREFEFLDLLNENDHINYKLFQTNIKDYSFNTINEFEKLKEEL